MESVQLQPVGSVIFWIGWELIPGKLYFIVI